MRNNDIEIYSTNNEEKSAIAEKFIRTLRTKFYKYMTSMSKNVYNHKLDDIVNKYNNTYHTTNKMLIKKLIKKLIIKILNLKLVI